MTMDAAMNFIIWTCIAINIASIIWHFCLIYRAARLNDLLVYLCVDAWQLRSWPLQHIVGRDTPPEPEPSRRWFRRRPAP